MIAVLIIVIFLVVAGIFFFFAATVGFLRFPDFYSRMHATGKGDTFGLLLSLLGLAIYNLFDNPSWYLGVVQSVKTIINRGLLVSRQPDSHPRAAAIRL